MVNSKSPEQKYKKFYKRILKNKEKFETLLPILDDKNISENEKVNLGWILLNALSFSHTGYFYSNILERFFVDIAQKYDIENYDVSFKPKTVLHVMTQCYETGGHTRVVERWIDNTKDKYENSVILLKQEQANIPKLLMKNIELSNGDLINLSDDMTLIEKGLKLRQIALKYQYIILHTHMDDPIATIAFGTEKFTRPVLFFNHADHMFWIGKTISDVVLDIRTIKSISPKYRDIDDAKLCPIPCDFSENIFLEKNDARKILNIDTDKKIILTSGSNFKFTPIGDDSIFDVYEKILSANKDVNLIVIGKNKYWDKIYKKFKNRIKLCSEVSFPEYVKYVSCADLIIDSYPMNGETTLIDAMRAKVPFLSLDVLCSGQNDYVIKSLGYCLTKNELIEKTLKCLDNKNFAEEVLENELNLFNKNYSKENWIANLEKIYEETPEKHSLRSISNDNAPCFIDDYSVVLERLYQGKKLYNRYGIPKIFEMRKIKIPNYEKIYKFILFGKEIYGFKSNLQKKKNVFIFSQNLKLYSIEKFKNIGKNKQNIFLTPHYLFPNEKEYLKNIFGDCIFRSFADYLTDEEMASCDIEAYKCSDSDYAEYLRKIKEFKNNIVLNNISKEFKQYRGYILSNDIGIDIDVWKNAKFEYIKGEYYYPFPKTFKEKMDNLFRKNFHSIYKIFEKPEEKVFFDDVYVSEYNNKKIIFLGKMHRIDYRLNLKFVKSKDEAIKYNKCEFYTKDECQYWTTWHEHFKCNVPDEEQYDVRWIQDGYLPSNYTDFSFCFKDKNVQYYAWDIMGTKLFKNKNLPVSLIPERKKIYMPVPEFPEKIKNVLVVASGSGDWTALKNRSDDDLLVYAFSKLAEKYPEINFTYRCHPTWVHPDNVGVNSINRVAQYYDSLNLPNLKLSTNIPANKNVNNFQMTFQRSSLEEDLKNADIVFGEHSISMIDAAFKNIPFASVNLSNRRDFYSDISEMGFLHCESIKDIENIIENLSDSELQKKYLKAVDEYNKMTDIEGNEC